MKDTKKVIIHIGMPRAASTFLQQAVFPNIKNYSFYGPPYTNSNNAFLDIKCLDPTIYNKSIVKKELKKLTGKKILISSEWFVGHNQWKYVNRTLIAQRLADFYPNATILLILRNQLSLLKSLYALGVRMGAITMPISKYFINQDHSYTLQNYKNGDPPQEGHREMVLKHKEILSPYIYQNIIDLYQNLFSSVKILLLEDLEYHPPSFIDQIEEVVGEKISRRNFQSKKVNKSLSPRQLTFLRHFNKLTSFSTSKLGINKILNSAKRFITSRGSTNTGLELPKNIRKKIIDFYAPHNKTLNQRYLNKRLSNYSTQYFLNQ